MYVFMNIFIIIVITESVFLIKDSVEGRFINNEFNTTIEIEELKNKMNVREIAEFNRNDVGKKDVFLGPSINSTETNSVWTKSLKGEVFHRIYSDVLSEFCVDIKKYRKGRYPVTLDWRLPEMVSPVKDQGKCISSWAHSVIGAVESHVAINYGIKRVLSEQMLIDCDGNNDGCNGGNILTAYSTLVKMGAVSWEDYEYTEKKGYCRYFQDMPKVAVRGYMRVSRNEDEMAKYVHLKGPLSAAINSNSMRKYTHGIDEPRIENCHPGGLDHAVLIVGYGLHVDEHTQHRTPYWIIKNSWGTEWGVNGYYYLVRGRNACGISEDVSLPIV